MDFTISIFGHRFDLLFSIIGIPLVIISVTLMLAMLIFAVVSWGGGFLVGSIGVGIALMFMQYPYLVINWSFDKMYYNENHAKCEWIVKYTEDPNIWFGHKTLNSYGDMKYKSERPIYENYNRCWENHHGGPNVVKWS